MLCLLRVLAYKQGVASPHADGTWQVLQHTHLHHMHASEQCAGEHGLMGWTMQGSKKLLQASPPAAAPQANDSARRGLH